MELTAFKASVRHFFENQKNLISLVVVLAGLFLGSLFVDLGQLVTGTGFSMPAIKSHDILVSGGKTWVGYTEPKVTLRIVNDDTCATCDPSEALLWLRRIVPTLEAKRVDIGSEEGKRLADTFDLVTIPAFIFDSTVKETEFYTQAEPLFHEETVSGRLVFDMNQLGMPIGRYLTAPETGEGDIILGDKDAPVTLMVFSDFECQYCKEYHATYKRLLSEYDGRIRIVWKHFPLPTHPKAVLAAEAAQCATAQDQFMPYADILFEKQSEWTRVGGEKRFKDYAWRIRGLDARAFSRCIDARESSEKVALDTQLAKNFLLESAPATFVNREFISGAAPYTDLKAFIETALSK